MENNKNNIPSIIENFWQYIKNNKIEIYNEFSFQHELGIYLRNKLPEYKIQFERNVTYFQKQMSNFKTTEKPVKHEIDITIFNKELTECYAIELKYPRNGQYPESMYSFIKDIKFMEQLKTAGFKETYCITIVDKESKPFYSGQKIDGIYKYFRNNKPITGKIYKPTGKNKNISHITIKNNYNIKWTEKQNWMTYTIKI